MNKLHMILILTKNTTHVKKIESTVNVNILCKGYYVLFYQTYGIEPRYTAIQKTSKSHFVSES